MTAPPAERATPPSGAPDLHATGERIEALLDASAAGGVIAKERTEELVRLVTDLYGAGLERVLTILHTSGRLDEDLLDLLAADELVSSLMIVHGLHPDSVEARVEQALERVRPYLGSHGGDVELLGVENDEVARLRLLGSCDGCPSSSATLELAVEDAIRAAAPEIARIEVETAPTPAARSGSVIPVESLRSRLHDPRDGAGARQGAEWHLVPRVTELTPGGVDVVTAGGRALLLCRVGADLFAFIDRCARCEASMDRATLARRAGAATGEAVLGCPTCGAHYDVRRAGACLDDPSLHLAPLPLIVNEEGASVAVPVSVAT